MWRNIGQVNPHDNKHNQSRDEPNLEPFAQASRLKLNESQLSGEAPSPQFLNQYFCKKRASEGMMQRGSEGMLQRVLSQKNIPTRPFLSPSASLKEVKTTKAILHSEPNQTLLKAEQISLNSSIEQIDPKPVHNSTPPPEPCRCKLLKKELNTLKTQQANLRKSINGELNGFSKMMQQLEEEVRTGMQKMEGEQEKTKKDGINPELVTKIRQESNRFNDKIRELQSRKNEVRQKYRTKLQEV